MFLRSVGLNGFTADGDDRDFVAIGESEHFFFVKDESFLRSQTKASTAQSHRLQKTSVVAGGLKTPTL
jgi:hypothetical protein